MAEIATDFPDDDRTDGTPPNPPEAAPREKYEIRFWHNDRIVYRFESDTFVMFEGPAIEFPQQPPKADQPAA